MTIAERVAKGVEWLDSERPEWLNEIDLNQLNMAGSCRCVLGQLFGNFHDRPRDLHPNAVAVAYGFECSHAGGTYEYPDLTREWRRVITSRREATNG